VTDKSTAEGRDRRPGRPEWPLKLGWGRAIAQLMKSHPLLSSQSALARQSGVPQSTIGRILRSEVDPHSANLERIAQAFGLTYSALTHLADGAGSGEICAELRRPARRRGGVPLLSGVPASTLGGSAVFEYPVQTSHWIECPRTPRGPRTVAYPVLGEPMAPEYPHGSIIYVDPDVQAVHGRDVVVVLADRKQVVFRRLTVERSRRCLRAIHPLVSHEVIPLGVEARILGVVVARYAVV